MDDLECFDITKVEKTEDVINGYLTWWIEAYKPSKSEDRQCITDWFIEDFQEWTEDILKVASDNILQDFYNFLQKEGDFDSKGQGSDVATKLISMRGKTWAEENKEREARQAKPAKRAKPILPALPAPTLSASQAEVQNLKDTLRDHREDTLRYRQDFRQLEETVTQQKEEIRQQKQEIGELHTMIQNLQGSVQYLFQQQQPIRTTRLAPETPARFASPAAPSSNSTAPFSSPATSTPSAKRPRACKKCNIMFPSGAKLYEHLPECQGQGPRPS